MAAILKTCFLNDTFQDIENASISVMDRGFIFGDAVYEVIPVFNGVAFHLDLHLQRLAQSLAAIQMSEPHSHARWHEQIYELIQLNGQGDQSVYLQVTRGVAPRDHAVPANLSPTVFMFSGELLQTEANPIAAITAEDIRWQRCDIKATSLLANVLLRTEASKQEATETILFRNGLLTEGAASNVFVVVDGTVFTSVKNKHILAGITRRLLVDILQATPFRVVERDISETMFREASEVWVTSSSKDLVPVIKLDGKRVGNGEVGCVFPAVLDLYQAYKTEWLAAEARALAV